MALPIAFSPAAPAWEPYFELDSFAHAEPVPVQAFAGDWDAPLEGGSDAVTRSWLESGVRHGAWSLGYVQRYDYEIKGSRDAAELYHLSRNKAPLPTGRQFDLELDAYHQRSQGLRAAWRGQPMEALQLEAGLSLLQGWTTLHGHLQGRATAVADNDYDYEALVDYDYTEDALFDRQAPGPSGEGFSFDAALRWQVAQSWSLGLRVRDLWGQLRWDDSPFTQARATSDTKEFDEDGFVRYNPTVSGFEGFRASRQRLHPEGDLRLAWRRPLQPWELSVQGRVNEVGDYWALAADYLPSPDWRLGASIMPRERALGLALRWRALALSWRSDALDIQDAHLVQLGLEIAWPL